MAIMEMMVASTVILAALHAATTLVQTLVLPMAQATLLVLASTLRVKRFSSRTAQCIDQEYLTQNPVRCDRKGCTLLKY